MERALNSSRKSYRLSDADEKGHMGQLIKERRMSYRDVVINLFGEIATVADLTNIARAGSIEGGVDWSVSTSAEEVADYILEMADFGEPATLVANGVASETEMFFNVRSLARAAGLSYVVVHGPAGEEGYDAGFSWRPGLPEEVRFSLANGSEPAVPVSQLKDAVLAGPEAVAALVAATEAGAEVGIVTALPEVVNAYRGAAAPAC